MTGVCLTRQIGADTKQISNQVRISRHYAAVDERE